MNIMIVSRDRFFISGAIELISQAWRPEMKSRPVFMIAEKNQPLLLPDIVITDTLEEKEWGFGHLNGPGNQDRVVTIFLAAQYRRGKRSWRTEHHISLSKKEAATRLASLFSSQTSALFPPSPFSHLQPHRLHRDNILSRQQTMVLKYIQQGLSLTDISRVTQLSVKTISTHKRAIMRKLGINNNSEFYQYVYKDCSPHKN